MPSWRNTSVSPRRRSSRARLSFLAVKLFLLFVYLTSFPRGPPVARCRPASCLSTGNAGRRGRFRKESEEIVNERVDFAWCAMRRVLPRRDHAETRPDLVEIRPCLARTRPDHVEMRPCLARTRPDHVEDVTVSRADTPRIAPRCDRVSPRIRANLAETRHACLAKTRPDHAGMRPCLAKTRPDHAGMRPCLARTQAELAGRRPWIPYLPGPALPDPAGSGAISTPSWPPTNARITSIWSLDADRCNRTVAPSARSSTPLSNPCVSSDTPNEF